MQRSALYASIVCLIGFDGSATENAPDDSDRKPIYTGEEVVVQAPRAVTTIGGASAVEAELDSLPVPAAASLENVLRELPMLHVRTNSRGEAEISARGSESRQVAVLVDGVPITLAWDARADVSVIPATALEDVTFTRGLSSMLHGPNVLGGVVEVRVGDARARSPERRLEITTGADDTGAFGTTVTTSIPFESRSGSWLARAGVGFRDRDGEPLADGIREPVRTKDDLRLNTDLRNVNGFVALRYDTPGGAWLSFSGSSFDEERGIAAELGVPDEDARLWRYPSVSRTLAVLSGGTGLRRSPFGGRGDLELSVGYDRGRTDIDAYATRAYDEVVGFDDGEDRTVTLRLLADQTLGRRGMLRGAFTWSGIRHDESLPEGDARYRQEISSVGVENVWRTDGFGAVDALSFSVGAAYDRAATPEAGGRDTQEPLSELGARAGLSAVMGRAVVHAGVSRRGRFPALRELYSGALDRFVPNPDLEPEKLLTTEAGISSRVGDGSAQLVVFHTLLEDAVVRVLLDDGTGKFMRVNRNELTSTGLELIGAHRLGRIELSANATLQSVDLTDTETDDTTRPENLPSAFGDARARFPIAAGAVGSVGVSYTGDQSVIDGITGDSVELDAEAILSASVSRSWPVRVSWGAGTFSSAEARIAVDNLGDVALYDAWGLPAPGRRIRLELRLR